ncbi:CCA tRNA nucleotidyltransferase [Roseibium algae]|uniref:CCA tRNA nucleotidyltransferase n=1 Tax=Roseibium algae TaxID=3123038 RepID=A0ABU8TGC8_9HYPH
MGPELGSAVWLEADSIQAVFEAIEQDGDQALVVGGAIRDTLLNKPVADVDIATTALPNVVSERALRQGLKVVPTGIDHGTVTVVSGGIGYEITTLRQDVETFGRQATVRFGRDWMEDARRRDFTMNAIYCDRTGALHDPLGGLPDCLERRVRFIGNPNHRIQEDYLRILRFFRIHAAYGAGDLDASGLLACVQERDGLRRLSAERIGMEMKRLVVAPLAASVVTSMEINGLMEIVTGGVSRLSDFEAFRRLAGEAPEIDEPALALVALSVGDEEDIIRLSDRLRLSGAERKRMQCALLSSSELAVRGARLSPVEGLRYLYRHGRQASVDGVLLNWARCLGSSEGTDYRKLLLLMRQNPVPVFPIRGRDLIAAGFDVGPELGKKLSDLETEWFDGGFVHSSDELLRRRKP